MVLADTEGAMLALLMRHSFVSICLAVFLEELGIPMPIPTDLLIIFAGVTGARSLPRLGMLFVAIAIASAIGSSGLYAVVRRGGGPLVERFGRYVHLGPQQLARGQAFLKRRGWRGIALGRATPGLRYLTVIACGLLNIPYRRYVTAHLAGSSVYIGVLLALGALFGPTIIDHIHIPRLWLRMVWLLALSAGLPLLLGWLCYRGHARRRAVPALHHVLGAVLLAGFAGTTALGASWATAAALTELTGTPQALNVTYTLARWLLGRGLRATSAYMLIYSSLLLLCVVVCAAYYELILPRLAPRGAGLIRQVLGLTLLGVVLVLSFLAPALIAERDSPVGAWWSAGGMPLLLTIGLGILDYALTTVYSRALAIAVLPSLPGGVQISSHDDRAAGASEGAG